jgi:SAM-dependent methyltransferase
VIDGGRYLDFGASSGRVIRNMHAAYPAPRWYACDPQDTAVRWARDNNPGIEFFVSPLVPPLDVPADYFDGVFANSIWSHFSESAALAWFSEMRRCIKPGGWLILTTHGPHTLRYYAQFQLKNAADIQRIYNDLCRDGYVFEDVFDPKGDWGIPPTDWGLCYILPSWVLLNLVGEGWLMADYKVGRAALNQDLYVLIKAR